ncbi:MAG: 3-octaprenyl-4-hydroxybenzoate carboxy-lyase, partial [Chitinophagales bacterium]
PVIPSEVPGLHEVNAVDAAGVHPVLLAIGSERYTPYYERKQPQEILTIANHILGFGQMSLAKFLIIAAKEDDPALNTHDIARYLQHVLERIDWERDLHFHTKATMDTLDYSGTGLNTGSKEVMAAEGPPMRTLDTNLPSDLTLPDGFKNPKMVQAGIFAVSAPKYKDEKSALQEVERLTAHFEAYGSDKLKGLPLILLTDDSEFVARTLNNFLWTSFTRCNPSHDIHGVHSFVEHKHWGCRGSLVMDTRIKPHHAPPLIEDAPTERKVDQLGAKGGSLHGII